MNTFNSGLLRTSVLAIAMALAAGSFSAGSAAAEEATRQAGAGEPGPYDVAAEVEPPAFADPEQAAEAFKKALEANDIAALAGLLGLDAEKLEAMPGAMDSFGQIRDAAAGKLMLTGTDDSRTIKLGDILWPFPFPLVKHADGWAFDTYAGIDEVIDRRVGENEMETIATLSAYVAAQQDYSDADRDEDGVLEYAQRLVSSEGQKDGLYWSADLGEESPAGGFVAEDQLDKASAGEGYYGYKYRILTRQGENIAGGAYDYIINGNMIAGHALVAWPEKYGETGVHSFLVSHHGIVYEADLGADTANAAAGIDSFNPGDEWQVVTD